MRAPRSKSLPPIARRSPIATAVMIALGSQAVFAQEQESGVLEEVIVTAQKRTENIQNVPISIDMLSNAKLEELNVKNFDDYVKMLPSIAATASVQGPGFAAVYMRGIVTGGDGQATTSQPSVGTYLDEQPITTIRGNLDVHLYDIARVEALAGPQGTLYGASSQAGTIRIITNKPDPSKFSAGYSLEGNNVYEGGSGYVAEGFVNIPVNDKIAVRLVGWTKKDAGWIDNLAGTRTYPGDASTPLDNITVRNDTAAGGNYNVAKDDYNTIEQTGARAALRIELNDNWTITPVVQAQDQKAKGSWGDDLSSFAPGKYAVKHFREEYNNDKWYQGGLTIEGKLGNFDLTYSGNYLNRDMDGSGDYSDYSYWYDTLYSTGPSAGTFANLFVNNAGGFINRTQTFVNNDHYTKQSHELRIASAQDKRLRGLLGVFWQRQYHDFEEKFGNMAGLADFRLMNRDEPNGTKYPGIVYLNSVDRIDTDRAVFGQLAYDLTDKLELTVGTRFFKPEVTVKGFFGYGLGFNPARAPGSRASDGLLEPGDPRNGGSGAFSPQGAGFSKNGEWRCKSQAAYKDAPCQNVDKGISESDHIGRVNLRWKPTEDAMLYATWSEGYRPGGINRNPFAGDFQSDFLTNWEMGWKTEWRGRTLQFNGAVFLEQWDRFQISFQGGNGITQVANGPSAEVKGTEMQLQWLATDKLMLSATAAYYDSALKDVYGDRNAAGVITNVIAPKGTALPITPKVKGNLVARYSFNLGNFDAHVQGAFTYSGSASSRLEIADNAIVGDVNPTSIFDFSAGIRKDSYSLDLFVQNATNEDEPLYKTSNCKDVVCGAQTYGLRPHPRTIGLKFSQKF